MNRIRRTALVFSVLGLLSIPIAAQSMSNGQEMMKKSLYERLGGIEAIKSVIDELVARVGADARVNKKFARSDLDRAKLHLVEQVCVATGGPCQYTGRDMKTTHMNMKVTESEFGALVEDLVGALDKFNVPAAEKNELLGILGPLKSQIVEVNSTETATALPADFKPAAKLSKKRIAEGPKMKKMQGSKNQ